VLLKYIEILGLLGIRKWFGSNETFLFALQPYLVFSFLEILGSTVSKEERGFQKVR
jgi:hypothetical protein